MEKICSLQIQVLPLHQLSVEVMMRWIKICISFPHPLLGKGSRDKPQKLKERLFRILNIPLGTKLI